MTNVNHFVTFVTTHKNGASDSYCLDMNTGVYFQTKIMVIEFCPFPLFIGLIILVLLLAVLWRRKHKTEYLYCFSLFFGYLLAVLWVVFFPIRVRQDWPSGMTAQNTIWTLSHINLNLFYFGELFSMNLKTIFEQLGGNILLTMPFGLGLPFLTPISTRRVFWLALYAGLALEGTQLVIELIGLVSGYGHTIDIIDVLLNAAGVLIGYGLFHLLARIFRALVIRFRILPEELLDIFPPTAAEIKKE
jgi:glycopeptide antibiotics resistance protein